MLWIGIAATVFYAVAVVFLVSLGVAAKRGDQIDAACAARQRRRERKWPSQSAAR